jgi:hypothetical protein
MLVILWFSWLWSNALASSSSISYNNAHGILCVFQIMALALFFTSAIVDPSSPEAHFFNFVPQCDLTISLTCQTLISFTGLSYSQDLIFLLSINTVCSFQTLVHPASLLQIWESWFAHVNHFTFHTLDSQATRLLNNSHFTLMIAFPISITTNSLT